MTTTITIRDETTDGRTAHEIKLDFLTETVTVEELIRSRVYQEVKDFNRARPKEFRGLVQPTDSEQTLNGYRLRRARTLEWQPQFERALGAFRSNQVLVLVDDEQVDRLDQEVTLSPSTVVSFVRLTPLVGG